MIDDFKKSIQLIINERITSPFSGAFFFSWFVWNWKMLYFLFFTDIVDKTLTLEAKIKFVESNYINLYHNLCYPFASAVILVAVYPFITTASLWVWLRFKKLQTGLKNKIEDQTLLTLPQSIALRQQMLTKDEEFSKILEEKDDESKNKQMKVDALTVSLDSEKREREKLAQALLSSDEELKANQIKVNTLTESLDSEKRERKKLELVNKPIHEILNYPLSLDNLETYTVQRFQGLRVDKVLQKVLLNDIKNKNYPTLREIDDAVNRAKYAVVAYQLEAPQWFESGTDYITKALGFVDADFRALHKFSPETMAAFNKYGSLVKASQNRSERLTSRLTNI